jgi:hypothetical protein
MHSPKAIFVILFFSFLLFPTISFSEPDNYCHDNQSWKEWDALVAENPNDMEIQTLHALRIGLCVKVDRGQITVEQATDIFESARETIVQKRDEDNKREQDRKKL